MYKVIWKDKTEKGLTKIDKKLAQKIFNNVETYLAKDPLNRGEPLTGQYKGHYRYRFSDYRYLWSKRKRTNNSVKVGHRKEIY